jgi:hypothetical protein
VILVRKQGGEQVGIDSKVILTMIEQEAVGSYGEWFFSRKLVV